MSGKSFDGRANFPVDDQIEEALDQHFQNFGVTPREIWRNFPIYTRRVFLKRFLAHYQLFQKTIDLPGDIVEIGVYRGATLLSWANFLEIHNMGDRQKRVFGFDNFAGFTPLDEKDGKESERVQKAVGGFSPESFEPALRDAIKIFDEDRFIPYKPRIVLVKGNAEETIPQFVKDYPGVRISLLHMDVDIYKPSLTALQHLWPLVVPGGVVAFDEYGIPPWEGESKAVDEFFAGKKIRMERFTWSSNPGAFVIKP